MRKVKFRLPDSYITSGSTAKKVFDIGIINLETGFMNEERELIVSKRRRSAAARVVAMEDERFDLFSHF